MKTEHLPHGHTAPRHRRFPAVLAALALSAASLPAWAMNPPPAKADEAAATAPAASASPAAPLPAIAAALPAAAAIATPDNQPLAAQLQALQKAQDQLQNGGSASAAADANGGSLIKSVLQRAFTLLGTPYRYGGSSPEGGFDCSGLVSYVFRTIGIDLPRVSRAMASEGTRIVSRDALAEGDLVFFGRRGHIDHVGIYIGNGQFLHAPRTGRDVTVSSLTSGYWAQKYMEARRLPAAG
ncbi:MAG: C40 family peptidase [Thermomonas sp.]